MEISDRIEGQHATPSPCGQFVAYISPLNGRLRVSKVLSPSRFAEYVLRTNVKDGLCLKWSMNATLIAVWSRGLIEIINLNDPGHRVRLDNGSGSLGQFRNVDFVDDDVCLTMWEFGRAKLWDLVTGKGTEIGDLKTIMETPAWQLRPNQQGTGPPLLAVLSRPSGEDTLSLIFTGAQVTLMSSQKIAGDIRAMSWSCDGNWLSLLGSLYTDPSLHVYTADGHHFKTIRSPYGADQNDPVRKPVEICDEIGIKEAVWSPDGQVIALPRFNGSISLHNTRTFRLLSVIEHCTTIDQSDFPQEEQSPVHEEIVSASGDRTYAHAPHPFSPPRSEIKDHNTSSDRGVVEARFSCDGKYFATRDNRMQSTVWVWNIAKLSTKAVIVQHSNVRKLHWHPSRPEALMLDCGEGIPYIFDASSSSPPRPLQMSLQGTVSLTWITTPKSAKIAILAATKSAFLILHPDGRDSVPFSETHSSVGEAHDTGFEEGTSEDSLIDMLSGRKPPPHLSYTELVDLEAEAEEDEDISTALDDTFREKRKATAKSVEKDPLDDSQIF
ncbi:hypothetical protein M433DRAFT_149251 [Acidomyces richmondensis BFW]|nr:MAG: hypothetical protein FE78DRAFT_88184 [Acidomyces sp. 'richmondensis']KYG50118.1 hypothetical protein M433DRAFT_149251 [Acidomyces richmondensis BFW]